MADVMPEPACDVCRSRPDHTADAPEVGSADGSNVLDVVDEQLIARLAGRSRSPTHGRRPPRSGEMLAISFMMMGLEPSRSGWRGMERRGADCVEHAPKNKRAFHGNWPRIGIPLGLVLATGMPRDDQSWGWRVPFLLPG